MTHKPTHTHEKRSHARHQVNVAEQIEIKVLGHSTPAVLLNVSDGGLSLLSFLPVPVGQEITLDMKLDHLVSGHVHARVVRVIQKGETYLVGVQLLELQEKWQKIVRHLEQKRS